VKSNFQSTETQLLELFSFFVAMTPEQALRVLRTLRFSPTKNRPITFAELARQAGYHPPSLFRVAQRGWMTPTMANRLGQVFDKTISVSKDHIAPINTLGALNAGRDPRGRLRLPGPRYPCGALWPRARRGQSGDRK
jgi:hypothetical protein